MALRKNTQTFWNQLFVTSFPRAHLSIAGTIVAIIVIILSFLPSDQVEANRHIRAISLPGGTLQPSVSTQDLAIEKEITVAPAKEADVGVVSTRLWQPTTLISGDNLTSIFKRLGLNESDVYLVANARAQSSQLRRLKPGEKIAIFINDEGLLEEVKYSRSSLEHYLYKRNGRGFDGEKILYEPEIIATFEQGIIKNSLFLDASRAGLTEAKIMELANIFAWDIDFALDIRRGDRFSVLYEEKYLEGEKVGDGNILAASFTNQGKTYDAVLFKEADGSLEYYAPDGRPMRKAFLRAPLDFTRISSNFNLRRKHPIHKKIRAHRGVDYAASRGTPVYAAGNGKVIAAGYSRANGNYVFVKHGQQFVTKYLHLNKRKVRRGQTVKQRQTIGTVGSTGYATGPHLHYEFLVNGVHRNPRTVKLPAAKPVAASKKIAFLTQTEPLISKLRELGSTQLALLTPH